MLESKPPQTGDAFPPHDFEFFRPLFQCRYDSLANKGDGAGPEIGWIDVEDLEDDAADPRQVKLLGQLHTFTQQPRENALLQIDIDLLDEVAQAIPYTRHQCLEEPD